MPATTPTVPHQTPATRVQPLLGFENVAMTFPGGTVALSGVYLGGFGLSHPLAKKMGAWPSVLTVAAVAAASSYVLVDRRGGSR